jgi:hypothetical protein
MLIAALVCTEFALDPGNALADDVPSDPPGFTKYVAAAFAKAMPGREVITAAPLRLSLSPRDGDRHVAYLDTLYAFCQQNPPLCANAVANHVRQIVASYRDEDAPMDKTKLRAVLRSVESVNQQRQALGGRGEPLAAPFLADLWIVCMVDLPTAMRTVSPAEIAKLGLSREEAMEVAKANVAATLPPLETVLQDIPIGAIGTIHGDPYESSRLLFPEQWRALAEKKGKAPIVAAPGTDMVIWTIPKDDQSVSDLAFAARMGQGITFRTLSTAIFRWTPTGWEIASP